MRVLGIDYGAKRIGLALSDESESIAFPFRVIQNDPQVLITIARLIDDEKIGKALIGISLTSEGERNEIEGARRAFVDALRRIVPVEEIDERLTSHEARLREFGNDERKARKEKRDLKEHIDADAAQIILQRYLDKQKSV